MSVRSVADDNFNLFATLLDNRKRIQESGHQLVRPFGIIGLAEELLEVLVYRRTWSPVWNSLSAARLSNCCLYQCCEF
jgi:hypothetical protein